MSHLPTESLSGITHVPSQRPSAHKSLGSDETETPENNEGDNI